MGVQQWGFQIAHERNKQELRKTIIILSVLMLVFGMLITLIEKDAPKKSPTHSQWIYIVPEVPNHNRKI